MGIALLAAGVAIAEVDPVVPSTQEEIDGRPWSFSAAEVGGTLRDAVTGAPLVGALVRFKRAKGKDEPFAVLHTGAAGEFSIRLRFGTYRVDIDAVGYAAILDQEVYTGLAEVSPPLNFPMSRPVGENEIRIAMSWTGEKAGAVKDIDAYLQIPGTSPPALLYFKHKGTGGLEGTELDRDDTDWEGPETVTIKTIRPGTYVYYVNNYSSRDDCGALARSGVRVTVTRGRRTVHTYQLEPGREGEGDGTTYRVFEIRDGELVDRPPGASPVAGYDDSLTVGGSRGAACVNRPPSIRWGTLEEPGR